MLITKSDIEDERARSRKRHSAFYKELDALHERKGTANSIRRHQVKVRNLALDKKKM